MEVGPLVCFQDVSAATLAAAGAAPCWLWRLIGSCLSPSLVAFAPVLRRGSLDLVWVCRWTALCLPALLVVSGSRLIFTCSP